ncbi:metallophosphoesterase [Nocardia vermiculata]|uniref:Metallophosphoesterase n=1 Tax=Nocardia vermiculata TaxID=257274 RepID=A0A846Y3H2_9NOCA|nr:metallophosphoesterase [Nocardia vermiculata]NKY53793.1 metallophosphoesterase [Nocardia vermiculata]
MTTTLVSVLLVLFAVPWWTLVMSGTQWPALVVALGTAGFAITLVALPVTLALSHGRHQLDWAGMIGDSILGIVWVLFSWSVIGTIARLVLAFVGVADPVRSRSVAIAVVLVTVVLLIWGNREAMRIPRVKQVEVTLPRLGQGLDGTRVVAVTDTHFGPIDRTKWSLGVAAAVNELRPDIVAHVGDIADGPVAKRRGQAVPLATMDAGLAKVYVTGNHEYLGEAQGWLDYMDSIGWKTLHNDHIVVERGGDRLVLAGVDDATAKSAGLSGHGANFEDAMTGVDPELPVLMLAHQPKQVAESAAAGVDLQIAGHTHGGQIWPFNFLVRLDQPTVHGLSRHGDRTQLYTSRGSGFWGPPFRIFAPSEITVITLRSA